MTKTQAISKLNGVVYYLPTELPVEITWQTPIPSGILSEICEKNTWGESVVTRTWGVVGHNTISLDELYTTSNAAQAALKSAYLALVPIHEAAAVDNAALAEATDTIGVDPNPPVIEEPIEP